MRHLAGVLIAVAGVLAASGVGAEGITFLEVLRNTSGAQYWLNGACSVAVSPDGSHLYAAGRADDAVAVFARDPAAGTLAFVEVQRDGVAGVDGLDGVSWIALSPDGTSLYAAALSDDAVAVFSRDPVTGALAFVEVVRDGVGGVDGLDGASALASSPDGSHLYAVGSADNAVAVFERNPSTGSLAFIEVQRDGVGGVDGLDTPWGVAVSPDGGHVYATGAADDAVAVFARDLATGALTFVEVVRDGVGGVVGLGTAFGVTVSPDGNHVYATGSFDFSVAVFARDPSTGVLTFVEAQMNGIGGVYGLTGVNVVTVSPDGASLYATAHWDHAVTVFARDPSTGALTFVEAQVDGVGGVEGLSGADSVTVSPDGAHLYAAGSVVGAVVVFARDPSTGALSYLENLHDGQGAVVGFDGARGVAVSPDGATVYVASWYDNAVVVLRRNPAAGALAFLEVERDNVGGVDGLAGAWAITVSPEGANVYVAGYHDSALAVFARDQDTGTLTFVEVQRDGVGGVDGLNCVSSVTVSPDGAHLYATGRYDDAVAVFCRDPSTGALTFVEVQRDGVGGVDGLSLAFDVAVSPDGAHVYVASQFDHAVAVFSRDPATGALTFVEVQRDGVGGVDGLDWASGVAVSPDGANVYVAALEDDAVAVFARDGSSGALRFLQVVRDGVGGVDGLNGATAVTVSPDGGTVVVAGYTERSVAVLRRAPFNGTLTYVEHERDGVNGVDGLYGATDLALSPGGAHLFVAGRNDDALAIFSVDGVATRFLAATTPADGQVNLLSGDLRLDGSFLDTAALPDGVASDGRLLYTGHAASGEVVAFLGGVEQWRWGSAPADLTDLEVVRGQLAVARTSSVDFHAAVDGAFLRSIPAPCAPADLAFDGYSLHLLCPTTIVAVDPLTGAVRSSLLLPATGCSGVGIASMADELVVACSDGRWFVVRASDGAVVESGSTGLALSGLATLIPQQLFLSQDDNPTGLYRVDPFSGAAIRSGDGASAVTSPTVGLAPAGEPGVLRGTTSPLVSTVWANGRYARDMPGSTGAEGLAFCTDSGVLYGSRDGALFALSSRSGLLVGSLAPSGADLEGLACDPVAQRLYGLGTDSSLWAYDIATDSWTVVGDTGLLWDEAGLAWDPTRGLLYALGVGQGDALYSIDPDTAAATQVGPMGISPPFGGGLAVTPSWRRPLPWPVFLDGFESGDAAAWIVGSLP